MKQAIVSDGSFNHEYSRETQEKLRALRERIQARYADQIASAGIVKRFLLWLIIEREFRRERKKILPSPQTLYTSGEQL